MTKCFNKIRCINWTIISDVTVICRRVPLEFEDDHVGSYTVPMSASVANKVRRTAFRKAIFYFNYTSNPLLSNLLSSPILSYPILSYPILSYPLSTLISDLFFSFFLSPLLTLAAEDFRATQWTLISIFGFPDTWMGRRSRVRNNSKGSRACYA